ncbi:hypothetical protein B0A52_00899 [Exophiala mesophila]|uniref:DNA replication regulator SLD2 n=1 Tax=Exophiala mesophila TaxID=212818 RepID=A0A438NIJ1_EXOME|nr:hypothetical protein B0A52_00899 [Exophiala mesophila]
MGDEIPPLDTPKKRTLQAQAETLKAALKDFERTYASSHHGRKPGREDIKADPVISSKYKEYNKVRDVLAGKVGLNVLTASSQPQRQSRSTSHIRKDSAVSLTPFRQQHKETPSKARAHPNDLDPYDAPSSASPRPMLRAVGPTPHRDGTILGIFDLLSSGGSRRGTHETPSSKKRKRDALGPNAEHVNSTLPSNAQTPNHRKSPERKTNSSLLAATTPGSGPATGRRNLSRTPASESKRFMLDHFFATPSAVRFATMIAGDVGEDQAKTPGGHKTPLRDSVLGLSPAKDVNDQFAAQSMDATPPYLKRSVSFKERLLFASATGPTSNNTVAENNTSPTSTRTVTRGPRHLRFGPKPLSQIIADRENHIRELREEEERRRSQTQTQDAESPEDRIQDREEDLDDDLDALREMEHGEINLVVGDGPPPGDQPVRIWKKKGQKRTTRRAIMRPVKMKPSALPKFVAAEDPEEELFEDEEEEDQEETVTRNDENHTIADTKADVHDEAFSDPDLDHLIAEAELATQAGPTEQEPPSDIDDEFISSGDELGQDFRSDYDNSSRSNPTKSRSKTSGVKKHTSNTTSSKTKQQQSRKSKVNDTRDDWETRKINPNAQSHMNFRSLKIRNKNSKAKGHGRGKFGRGRR